MKADVGEALGEFTRFLHPTSNVDCVELGLVINPVYDDA
jgi:hypothetical protein